MALAILSVTVFLVLIVCSFVLTGLRHRRREIAALQQRHNNIFPHAQQIFGEAGTAVIVDNGFENGSDRVDPIGGEERAEIYLRRIVALTGATQMSNYCVLEAGKTRFHVYDRNVVRLRHVTDPKSGKGQGVASRLLQRISRWTCAPEQTCFHLAHQDMPAAERIATALLQLKNNPELFDSWVDKRAAFKADGHVFSFSRVQ
jgi:hypothetical protein